MVIRIKKVQLIAFWITNEMPLNFKKNVDIYRVLKG